MDISKAAVTLEYVLDMLEQLSKLARDDGLDRLAGRIETAITAERFDFGMVSTRTSQKPERT